uniref:Uncharacterized protein n=1 Tax=Anguilla anguilla TaxID=7936 RepID=A0A0E9QVS4_ANGAN
MKVEITLLAGLNNYCLQPSPLLLKAGISFHNVGVFNSFAGFLLMFGL